MDVGMTYRLMQLVVASTLAGALGCSSDSSGIDGQKKLVELNASENTTLCHYITDAEMGPRDVTCDGGLTLHVHSFDQCIASAHFASSCTATVAQSEACADAIGADPCSLGGSACQPLFTCGGSGSGN